MNKQELKFWIREEWYKILLTLKYFILEPWFILRRLLYGKYTNMIIFWFVLLLYIVMWQKGVTGKIFRTMGIIVLLTYLFMFHRSGKAEKYYKQEYIEGKEIE